MKEVFEVTVSMDGERVNAKVELLDGVEKKTYLLACVAAASALTETVQEQLPEFSDKFAECLMRLALDSIRSLDEKKQ